MKGVKKLDKFDSYRPYSAATHGVAVDGRSSFYGNPAEDGDISRRQFSASPGQIRESKVGGITTPKKNKNFLIKNPSAKTVLVRPNTGGQQENITNDFSRIKPRIVQDEKEKLFEDIHMYKLRNNMLYDDNLKLKTKLLNLEKENAKFEKIIEEIEVNGLMNNQNLKINNDKNSFAAALKKSVKDLKIEIRFKTQEIESLKKSIKFTKIQEIEIEKKQFADETVRLKKILEKLKYQNSEFVGKDIDFTSLEEKYYMQDNIINQLKKDLQENMELRRLQDDEIMKLKKNNEAKDKQIKLKSIEMKKAVQEKFFELQNLKSDFQIAARKLQLLEAEDKKKSNILNKLQHDSVYGKYLQMENSSGSQMAQQSQKQGDSASKARPNSSKRGVGAKNEGGSVEKNLRIQELEAKIKNMSENFQELINFEKEEKKLLQQELEREKNASQGWRSKYEALLGSPSRNEKRIGEERPQEKRPQERVRSPNIIPQKVRLEEINSTIEELKFRMLANDYELGFVVKSILPTSSEDSNEVSMAEIKDLLMIVNNEKEAEKLAKYLVERSLNEEMREVLITTTVNCENVKNNFKKLFGSYNVMDQELKEQISEELTKIIDTNKVKIEKSLNISNKRDEKPSRNGFKEIFQLVDVNISDTYLDYIMCSVYKTPAPESLNYTKIFEQLSEPNVRSKQSSRQRNDKQQKRRSVDEYADEKFEEEPEIQPIQTKLTKQDESYNEYNEEFEDDNNAAMKESIMDNLRESQTMRTSIKDEYDYEIAEDDGDT